MCTIYILCEAGRYTRGGVFRVSLSLERERENETDAGERKRVGTCRALASLHEDDDDQERLGSSTHIYSERVDERARVYNEI